MGARSTKILIFSIAITFALVALGRAASLETDYETVKHCTREGLGPSCVTQRLSAAERPPDLTPQFITLSDGEKRTYLMRRPEGSGPKPTIIVLHGVHGIGLDAAVDSGLGRFAPDHGYVGVFPDARAGLWNAFPPGKVPESVRSRAGKTGVGDDALFLKELVADLVHRRIADPRRVYVAGLSMGGFMALDMACTDADAIEGVALVSSSMPEATGESCRPARPIALLVINGTADESVPYAGGPVDGSGYNVWATDRTLEFFRHLDGCHDRESGSEVPPLHPGQVTRVSVHEWSGCMRKVTLYRVQGGEHEFPPIGLDAPSVMIEFFNSIR